MEAYFQTNYRRAQRLETATENDDWLEDQYHIIYGTGEDGISQAVDNSVQSITDQLKKYVM